MKNQRLWVGVTASLMLACADEPGPTGAQAGSAGEAAPTVAPAANGTPPTANGPAPAAPPGSDPAQPPTTQPPAAMPGASPAPAPGQGNEGPVTFPTLTEPAPFLSDMGGGWVSLVQGKWELPPRSEGYTCVRFTLPEPVAFASIVPLSPLGTHHTVVSFDDVPTEPDGTGACDALTNGDHILSASGVGTEAAEPLPSGVSYQLPAGAQLLLNLHLYNVSDEPLAGVSGSLVKLVEASEGDIPAENILAGAVRLSIPPGEVTQTGRCTFTDTSTIVQVFPHMHRTGVHMKVVAHGAATGEVVLRDGPFNFEEQLFYAVEPLTLHAGDYVTVECTYQNDTGATLTWGDSTDTEMCFAGLVRYPPLGGNFRVACTQ